MAAFLFWFQAQDTPKDTNKFATWEQNQQIQTTSPISSRQLIPLIHPTHFSPLSHRCFLYCLPSISSLPLVTMAIKRKFEVEADDVLPSKKQLKFVPFPNVESDNDIAMSEAEPLYPDAFHMRLPSNASSTSSDASNSPVQESPSYPGFNLYPLPFFNNDGSIQPNSHSFSHYANQSAERHSGLLQPSTEFRHHGTGCSQIPKLRIACASGLNGQRTMWSFCEQCGAISMVESD